MYWISVNEKLPDDGQKILVYYHQDIYTAVLYNICILCQQPEHFTDGTWCADTDTITYWMHLPKPPAYAHAKSSRYERKKRPLNHHFNARLK